MEDCNFFFVKMKIVHLCLSSFFIDGYSYQENMLAKYHVKMGYAVTVIASLISFGKDGKRCVLEAPSEYVNEDGVKVIRLAYKNDWLKRFNERLRRYEGMVDALCHEEPDIIFVHGTSFMDVRWVVKYKRSHPMTKIFADSHADWINSGRNWLSLNVQHKILWRYTTKRLESVSEKVFGVLPVRCDFLKQIYKVPQEKVEYLPMGVDDEALPKDIAGVRKKVRDTLRLDGRELLVVTGGKIDTLKNTLLLMQAVNKMDERVHLLIFGTVLPDIQESFKKLLSNKIHYVGWNNAQQVMNYLVAADVACFPGTHSTLWEESVGVGVPCVSKSWQGMHHVDQNGNCVFLYKDSELEIEQVLERFLDKDYYQNVLEKAKIAALHFRYSQIAKKAIGIIR